MKLSFLLASLLATAVTSLSEQVLSIHGSGTTNPSKCYWSVMEHLEARSRKSVRLSYRAVGSGTGQKEFVNVDNTASPASDFGSGDIPLTTPDWQLLKDAAINVVHLPVVLGAVTFFHNVKDASGNTVEDLKMTACVLARIYNGEIKSWDDGEVTGLNPDVSFADSGNEITILRRLDGSSSTSSITDYFRDVCPNYWPADATGKLPDWPEESNAAAKECQGSSEMTDCIRDNVNSIGYLDAGHGTAAGLTEILLRNLADRFLNSVISGDNGGIAAAVDEDVLPVDPTADFGDVSLLNRAGEYTFPIVQMTFMYVRQDLASVFNDTDSQSLLIAFLTSLYDPDYNEKCITQFGFTALSSSTRQYALDAIDTLVVDPNAVPFVFEGETDSIIGAGDYIISRKRNNFLGVQTEDLETITTGLQSDLDAADLKLSEATELVLKLEAELKDNLSAFSDEDDMQLKAALTLSSISFVLWMMYLLMRLCGYFRGSGKATTKSSSTDVV